MSADQEQSVSDSYEASTALRAHLAAMVVKTGLGLGQMTDGDRLIALALPAHRLREGDLHSEAEVNALLKDSLANESAFLRTDHVELRRWLVDTGWWRRDGFGRAYVRPPVAGLPERLQAIASALSSVEPAVWGRQQIHNHRAAQQARRARWNAAPQTLPRGEPGSEVMAEPGQ